MENVYDSVAVLVKELQDGLLVSFSVFAQMLGRTEKMGNGQRGITCSAFFQWGVPCANFGRERGGARRGCLGLAIKIYEACREDIVWNVRILIKK